MIPFHVIATRFALNCFRVTNRSKASHGVWIPKFISNHLLQKCDHYRKVQYLKKNDCLFFRVLSVDLDPASPSPLPSTPTGALQSSHRHMSINGQPNRVIPYEFRLSEYTQCHDIWRSRAFYTHAEGYRICIKVFPEGNNEGKNTHVSVYVYVMKGEHDDTLKWPFRGDITIQLLNQLGDECHHEVIIRFTGMTPGLCCDR